MKKFISLNYAYVLSLAATICLMLQGHGRIFLIISIVLHVLALIEFITIFRTMRKMNKEDTSSK